MVYCPVPGLSWKGSVMKLQSLELKNFRCFEQVHLDLHPQLTVLVGENGKGKTTLLDALALLFDTLMLGMRYASSPSMRSGFLSEDDIYSLAQDKMISYTLVINQKPFHFEFREDPALPGEFTTFRDGKPNGQIWHFIIQQIMNMVPAVYKHKAQPVFIYYPSKRNVTDETKKNTQTPKDFRKMAFAKATAPSIDFSESIEWFTAKATEEALEGKNKNDYFFEIPELTAVRKAITTALEGYVNPRIGGSPHALLLTNEDTGIECSFSQLSDGYKAMLALVIDLARRMAVLNEKSPLYGKEKVLESPAVVLIDEIELHLHPRWQQTVLPSLMEIFPNTQFVVTTHSPQVISSVEPEHIRILHDCEVVPVETSTYGAENSRILEEVFGAPIRPDNKAKKTLDKYLSLINDGQGNTDCAKDLRVKLDKWLSEDPILDRADMFIMRNARRKEREEKSHAKT